MEFKKIINSLMIVLAVVFTSNAYSVDSINKVIVNSYKVIANDMISGQRFGSAFNAGGYIITNRHVVKNAQLVRVVDMMGKITKTEIIDVSDKYDLALLKKIDDINSVDSDLTFCEDSNLKIGTHIYNFGNPRSEDFILTKGYISGLKRSKPYFKSANLFLTHNDINTSGQSGSAIILTSKHCVVGVLTGSLNGSYVGYSIPVETVKSYINEYKENHPEVKAIEKIDSV